MASISSRIFAAMFAFGTCGCADDVARLPVGGPQLQPMAYFTGRSHGDGRLAKLFSKPVKVSVESFGHRQGETLILDQTIHEGGSPPSVRRWTMRPTAPNRYTGTLTDAKGPVNVVISGSRADIRYTTRAGFTIEQQLVLQKDGKTILNRLRALKFGIPVATLNETIRKLD